jgi:uncharacterized protein (TIGR02284 family)
MSQDSQYASGVLNGLLEMILDSAEGYEEAAALARNPRFGSLFKERAQGRRAAAQELEAAVAALGASPVEMGSMLGDAHRLLVAIRDRISGGSDKGLIEEVARGEGILDGKFEAAARDEGLSADMRTLVVHLRNAIGVDYDQICNLKAEFQ